MKPLFISFVEVVSFKKKLNVKILSLEEKKNVVLSMFSDLTFYLETVITNMTFTT